MGWTTVLSTRAAWVLAATLACGWTSPAPAQAQGPSSGKTQVRTSAAAVPQAGKQRAAVKKKVRPPRKAGAGSKRPQSRKRRAGKPTLATRPAARKPAPAARDRAALAPVARTLPPLGPERFYPDGIPQLRPEFLHPLPAAPAVSEPVAAPRVPGAEPEWLP